MLVKLHDLQLSRMQARNVSPPLPMAKYLITGIAGFIGSGLARALLKRGDQVRGIDNYSTGKSENLEDVRQQIDFREVDLLDLPSLKAACQDMDYVLHQAAIPS